MAYNDKKASVKWQEKSDAYKVEKYKVPKTKSVYRNIIIEDEYEKLEKYANLFREQQEKEARERERIREQRELKVQRELLEQERILCEKLAARQRKIEEAERQLANSNIQDLGLF